MDRLTRFYLSAVIIAAMAILPFQDWTALSVLWIDHGAGLVALIGLAILSERLFVGATVGTLERLERYRGHFLNWYDTSSLAPLRELVDIAVREDVADAFDVVRRWDREVFTFVHGRHVSNIAGFRPSSAMRAPASAEDA